MTMLVVLCTGFMDNLRAQEQVDSSLRLGFIGTYTNKTGERWQQCNGAVVYEKDRPVVCFGVKQRPGEKGKYLYIILFKGDPAKVVGDGFTARSVGIVDGADAFVRIIQGKKAVEITYQYTEDEKTHAIKTEMLKLGDTEIKDDSPRVFLVDLTQEKIAYRPVKVDLPDAIPTLGDRSPGLDGEQGKAWASTMQQAVGQLKKKSPEVKKFLEP